MTVAQLLDRWYQDVLRHQVAESAALGYRSVANHHIVPTLGKKKLASLTTSDVDRLLSSKIDSHLPFQRFNEFVRCSLRPSIKALGGAR